jgi:hypothetical protein
MGVRDNIRAFLSETRDPASISADIFPRIDLEHVRKKIQPKKYGDEDGESNLPASDAAVFSATEIGLQGEFQSYQQVFIERFNQQQLAYSERVHAAVQSWDINVIRNEEEEHINKVIAQSTQDAADLDARKMTMIGRGIELLAFRNSNKLMNRLPDIRNVWVSLTLLSIFYVAELGVTFFLTREAGDALSVLLVAIVYCTLNCAIPWWAATFCRPMFFGAKRELEKFLGYLTTVVVLFIGLSMNLMMGHYRDVSIEIARGSLAVDRGDLEASQVLAQRVLGIGSETIERLTTAPWAFGEPQAILLALFGIVCLLVSWHDGLVRDDKYPKYGKQFRLYSEAYDAYDEELSAVTQRLIEAQKANVDHIQSLKRDLVASVQRVPLVIQSSRSLTDNCKNALATLQTQLQQLVTEYRMANQSKRSQDRPAYFDSRVDLSPLPINSPVFPNIDDGVKQKLETALDQFSGEIHSKYAKILAELHDGPSVLRQAEGLRVHPLTVETDDG